jgi:hypothetical protein
MRRQWQRHAQRSSDSRTTPSQCRRAGRSRTERRSGRVGAHVVVRGGQRPHIRSRSEKGTSRVVVPTVIAPPSRRRLVCCIRTPFFACTCCATRSWRRRRSGPRTSSRTCTRARCAVISRQATRCVRACVVRCRRGGVRPCNAVAIVLRSQDNLWHTKTLAVSGKDVETRVPLAGETYEAAVRRLRALKDVAARGGGVLLATVIHSCLYRTHRFRNTDFLKYVLEAQKSDPGLRAVVDDVRARRVEVRCRCECGDAALVLPSRDRIRVCVCATGSGAEPCAERCRCRRRRRRR